MITVDLAMVRRAQSNATKLIGALWNTIKDYQISIIHNELHGTRCFLKICTY
jgi:hypothetical protein